MAVAHPVDTLNTDGCPHHLLMFEGFEFKNHHTVNTSGNYVPEDKVYISCVQTDGLGLGAWTKPGRGSIFYVRPE